MGDLVNLHKQLKSSIKLIAKATLTAFPTSPVHDVPDVDNSSYPVVAINKATRPHAKDVVKLHTNNQTWTGVVDGDGFAVVLDGVTMVTMTRLVAS